MIFLAFGLTFRASQIHLEMIVTFCLYKPAVSTWTLLHKKLSKLLSGDDIKAVQKTVIALGHMCVKESSSSHLNIALDLIFSLSRSKVGEIF